MADKIKNYIEEKKQIHEIPKLIDYLKSYLEAGLQPANALGQIVAKKTWCFTIQQTCERIVMLHFRGMSLAAALSHAIKLTRNNSKCRYLCFLFSSLRLGYVSGGNMLLILEKVKEKTENSIQIERKIKVTTAQMRLQGLVIMLSPFFLAVIIWFISPDYILFFFRNIVGNILLVLMIIFNISAFYFLNNIVRIKHSTQIISLYETSDFIDCVLLYLETGHNIYFSFKQAAEQIHSVYLKEKCEGVILNYSLGSSLIHSFKRSLEKQVNEVFKEMVENIIISLELGTPLVKNLSHLSLQMKTRASCDLEEIAAKAPIKMIFPLVFFIFPVILILLGAGAIEGLLVSLSN